MQQVRKINSIRKSINFNTNLFSKIKRNNIFDNETIESLLKSEDDIEQGRTRKASEVIKEFKEKYGF